MTLHFMLWNILGPTWMEQHSGVWDTVLWGTVPTIPHWPGCDPGVLSGVCSVLTLAPRPCPRGAPWPPDGTVLEGSNPSLAAPASDSYIIT